MFTQIERSPNFTKSNYDLAKKNNDLDRFRGDEISWRIGKIIPNNEQQALQTNMLNDLINGQPFSHRTEWEYYQSIRASVKTQVDADIQRFENGVTL